MVDIATPANVLDSISEVLRKHIEAEAAEFKADSALVSFTSCGDPLKVQLLVCFDYSHNGEQPMLASSNVIDIPLLTPFTLPVGSDQPPKHLVYSTFSSWSWSHLAIIASGILNEYLQQSHLAVDKQLVY